MAEEGVGRDTLRAELGALELRVIREITAVVQPLTNAIARIERGEFNDAQRRAIAEVAEGTLEDQAGLKWTRTSRFLVVCGALVSFVAMCATVTVAVVTII